MALPVGKLTILIGAGIAGSILAKEGRLSNVSDFFSGALKVVVKGIRQDESTTSDSQSGTDTLMAQVNSLSQELRMLASSRSVKIVTASGKGATKYSAIVIVLVVGYGYVWWKGWKLPDLMFATRLSLSDACTTIEKQLESVHSSIWGTKRQLSSRIDHMDQNLDEFAQLTASTRDTVSDVSSEMEAINLNVISVRSAVEILESKLSKIEGKQDITNVGILELCNFASTLEMRSPENIQASPSASLRPALQLPAVASPLRTGSLLAPVGLSLVSPITPNTSGSRKVSNGCSESAEFSNGIRVAEHEKGSSIFGFPERSFSSSGASFITKTQSITNAILQQMQGGRQET